MEPIRGGAPEASRSIVDAEHDDDERRLRSPVLSEHEADVLPVRWIHFDQMLFVQDDIDMIAIHLA
jgi:hypothetical protein